MPALVEQVSCYFGQVLETSKLSDSTFSLGNLFHCCTTLLMITSFVMSNLNLQFVAIAACCIICHLWEEPGFLICFWHVKTHTEANIHSIQHSPAHIGRYFITDWTQVCQERFALGLPFCPYMTGNDFQKDMLHDLSRDWDEPHLFTVPPPKPYFLPCLKMDITLAFS